MSRFVNVASVLFTLESIGGSPDARQRILDDAAATLKRLEGLGLDLVVFSEGVESLAQSLEQAEEASKPGPVLGMYRDFARRERCHVAGSVKLREGARVYNSIAYIGPDGSVLGAYHKTYLTRSEIDQGLTCGRGAVVVDTAIGRLGGAICFDLNFEPLRQEYAALHPDILAFPSLYHGGLVQGTWAYACRAFFVSALPFHGGGILDPYGRPVAVTDCYHTAARARINLDRVMAHLDFNREKFDALERKYRNDVCIDIPPNVGSALIYSLSDLRTAQEIAREFGVILLDDYLRESAEAAARGRA